jgi:hypothetical protein
MKPSKTVLTGAAVAGFLSGSIAARTYAASTSGHAIQAGVSVQTMADAAKGKHACKGQNDCKGQGGCKTAEGGPGQNSCKGKGGCRTDGGPMPKMLKSG